MTKITFHFTESLEKRRAKLNEAKATKKNTVLNIRGTEVAWTGDEADLAVANEAYVR